MPEQQKHLRPSTSTQSDHVRDEAEGLRFLSRSPHPYHRHRSELLDPSEQSLTGGANSTPVHRLEDARDELRRSTTSYPKESTPTSDSGTEADDEHFLKGLPAPRTRSHKGIRGRNELQSASPSPLLAPVLIGDDDDKRLQERKRDTVERLKRRKLEVTRRRKEIIRRCSECLLLGFLGAIVYSNATARPLLKSLRIGLLAHLIVVLSVLVLYPARLVLWAHTHRSPCSRLPVAIPSSFDPAPLLYPLMIPLYVSTLVATTSQEVVLWNLVLSLGSLPKVLFPLADPGEIYSTLQWLLSCIPYFCHTNASGNITGHSPHDITLEKEVVALLYPLHQTLCAILHQLTTTSLLPAELQLLSIALINILFLSRSPQAVILKGLLWLGGLGVLILCGRTIRWGVTLARVPKWRFRKQNESMKNPSCAKQIFQILSMKRLRHEMMGASFEHPSSDSAPSSDEEHCRRSSLDGSPKKGIRHAATFADVPPGNQTLSPPRRPSNVKFIPLEDFARVASLRRNTIPDFGGSGPRSHTHTPSGRRKRSASSSVRAFFVLTQREALVRKWLYAGWVYACIVGIVLIGVRTYVGSHALHDHEPIGWALAYLFGDVPWFRFQVVQANLERWVCLPQRAQAEHCSLGWIEHMRQSFLGEANTRLLLSAYWLVILVFGLAVVFKLSPVYEVDTRRKVFHFMMVAMFLPATFVDPTYAALALSIILAVFLLLDLIRASQLPPLSKPIASFLTPYVDGRDLRGPVVISHIFLLIGCAIPLWLSLGSLPRTGSGALAGWSVPTRDVSMVSGVVCVGLGDAAASLIGRRWGHRKWLWGGGKSLEGSVAFAVAVFLGLFAAATWLRVGGWPVTDEDVVNTTTTAAVGGVVPTALTKITTWDWAHTARNAGVCASVSSFTEAVLTGGNDNVVVPVMLWTCVKSLGL